MDRNYYLVRAMDSSIQSLDVFFKNEVVAVGWSEVNFTKFSVVDQLVSEVNRIYYTNSGTAASVIGKKRNEIRRFKGIRAGDRIVIPYWSHICLATAKDTELYNKDSYELDLANQRTVSYVLDESNERIKRIPRDNLSEQLQRRSKVPGTAVADLIEFSKEIESLFKGEDYNMTFNNEKIRLETTFKDNLLNNIQSGKTNLKAGGIGLEILVKELLNIEGFNAVVLPKKTFPGFADADVVATKHTIFGSEELLIQVKHHTGNTDTWGANQLTKIKEIKDGPYLDYKLVLLTTGNASVELRKRCEEDNITLIDGKIFIDWLYTLIPELEYETKRKLSIFDLPTIIEH